MQELLPCPLNLSAVQQQREQAILSQTSEAQTNLIEEAIITNYDNNEVLVDIDSDPDYQRILSQFRKTMATCR